MKVHTVFTTRHDGDMRKKNMTDAIVAEQVHGNTIAVVSLQDVGKVIPNVDGLVSRDRVRLVVHVADCVPILAHDIHAHILGAAHAGWRGTLGNIAKNLIASMKALGAEPVNIRVTLGPHIGVCCYDVPRNRAKKFSPNVVRFESGAWYIDLGRANYLQCIEAGVVPPHISVSDQCTACNVDTYFSFRKDLPRRPASPNRGEQAGTKKTFGEQMGVISV
jgi:YfiH family protein